MAQDLCKYYKKQRYVSYNDGLTWQPLEEYEKGELYETHSASCGAGVFQYRWVLVDNSYICDGKDRYTREVYQYSEDGVVWYNTFPTQYRKGYLVESNSPFCDNAGNGQYTSGDTEPLTGDTNPCPPNYVWNGTECVCKGRMINGECVACDSAKHEHWDDSQQMCVCDRWYRMVNGICVYVDPLKDVKCSNSDGILKQSDVNYYENGWAAMSYTVGDCITKIGDNAFNGQIFLTSVTISNTVSEIGNLAFANCRSLETVSFPNNITSFGNNVFLQCSSLKNVTFGGTIPSEVPIGAFCQCEKLETATWLQYNNITSIGYKAFYNCYSLNNVTLPDTLQTIGINAFYGNRSLTTITIPSSVTSIEASAFENCTAMTFANINSNEVAINNTAFRGNTSLTAVTITSSGLTIGNDAFDGCTRLLKLTFTATVPPQIEEGDFDNTNECALFVPCGSLEAYKTAWTQYADRISCNDTGVYYRWVLAEGTYCDGYDEYTREKKQSTTNGITWTDTGDYRLKDLITHYSENCGYSDDVALTVTYSDGVTRYYEPCNEQPIPDVNKLVANYSDNTTYTLACNGNSDLTENEVRDFTTSYSSMTSVVVGNCVAGIGENAFRDCSSLLTATLPSTIGYIDDFAFGWCDNIVNLTINAEYPPELGSYRTIPDNGCPIYVPCASVDVYKEVWSNYADRIRCNDEGLSYRWINDGTICVNDELHSKEKQQISWDNEQSWHDTGEKRINQQNLGDCRKLYATFDSSDPYIIDCTSMGGITSGDVRSTSYKNIKTVSLGGCVTSIENNAFSGCTNLTSINIPNNVTSIGIGAFMECTSLTSVIIPNNVTSIRNYTFDLCESLSSVTIPSGVTNIGEYAFGGCHSLTSVTIPDSVTSIGTYAFGFCSGLTSCTIGSGVTSIGSSAFQNCKGLTSIDIPNAVQKIGVGAFEYNSGLQSINIGSGVTEISNYAFGDCTSLTSVTIPSSLTTLGVFDTFEGCTHLTSITFLSTTPPSLGDYDYGDRCNVFDNTNNCPIYVPAASVDAYKTTMNLKKYASRIQAIPN